MSDEHVKAYGARFTAYIVEYRPLNSAEFWNYRRLHGSPISRKDTVLFDELYGKQVRLALRGTL